MHTVIKYKNNEKALHKSSKGYILICFQYQHIVAANFVINLSGTSRGHLVQHLAQNNAIFKLNQS